jgi:hypothetical protein
LVIWYPAYLWELSKGRRKLAFHRLRRGKEEDDKTENMRDLNK